MTVNPFKKDLLIVKGSKKERKKKKKKKKKKMENKNKNKKEEKMVNATFRSIGHTFPVDATTRGGAH